MSFKFGIKQVDKGQIPPQKDDEADVSSVRRANVPLKTSLRSKRQFRYLPTVES